MESIKIRKGN
jgi:hypothetical protein